MNGQQLRGGFHFDNDASLDHEVEPIAARDAQALVNEGQAALMLEAYTAERELVREAQAICGFEQTGSQLAMDLDACADDLLGDLDVGSYDFHARGCRRELVRVARLLPVSTSPRLPVHVLCRDDDVAREHRQSSHMSTDAICTNARKLRASFS